MEIWQAIVLGLVQGFTEFLPISSSGHLIMFQHWLGVETTHLMFNTIMLHVGTLIPVIIVLWKQIIGLFKKPFNMLGNLVLASIPAGVVGLLLHFLDVDLDTIFTDYMWILCITFMLTAAELLFTEYRSKKVELSNGINYKSALVMGAGQMLAVIPGLSRSGTTISAGTLAKVNREDTANFSFLMSIPIILAAIGLEGIKMITEPNATANIDWAAVMLGMLTAAISGYIAIKFMLALIKKANYKWFSLYLVLFSVVTLLDSVGVF